MKKILALVLIFAVFILLIGCSPKINNTINSYEKDRFVYFIAGFDDAAENTDVLFTVAYDFNDNTVRVAQIPRDTYIAFGGAQNKINQIYAVNRFSGDDKKTAMHKMVKTVEESFGVRFDGYLGITLDTFRKAIDAIGGVDINSSEEMILQSDDGSDLILKKGVNHINGEAAEKFVRYRKGYITGDLGRIDAQKLFLNALFVKLSKGINFTDIFNLAMAMKKDVITDIKISEGLDLVSNILKAPGDKTTYYVTIPGEAICNKNGLSFYVLNRKSVAEMVKIYMFAEEVFDPKHIFLNCEELGFVNIYEDDTIEYREYSNKTLNEINLTPR